MFGREWAGTDTSGICLYDANDFLDSLRWDAETSADAADGARGRGDIGISSKIEVKHKRICTFNENALV